MPGAAAGSSAMLPEKSCPSVTVSSLGVAPRAGRAVDDGRRRGHRRVDALAGPQVGGEERGPRRDGPIMPGENADITTAVQQPRGDKLPEAAGAASDKDRRGHEALLMVLGPQEG